MSQSARYQLLPLMSDEEFQTLRSDIRLRGVLVPLEYDEAGNILDGHHRWRAIQELLAEGVKVNYTSIIRAGLSEEEKRAHVRAINMQRRHLTQAQRRELIADQLRDTPSNADTIIARSLGVTDKTVGAVRRDMEARSEIPTVTERFRTDGKISPLPKARSVVAKNHREKDRALAALSDMRMDALPNHQVDVRLLERIRRESHAAERAKGVESAPSVIGSADIRFGDFRSVLNDIPDASADLVLTDPPYAREYLSLWLDLGAFAARVLRPGGVLLAYSGQSHLPTVLAALNDHLEYIWMIAQTNYARKSHDYHVRIYANWKPVLLFAKPPYAPRWFDDILPGTGAEKDAHAWQQREDEARKLIETFTREGDLVIDPFCGSGTTAAASVLLGRRCICADVDRKAVATSRERVGAVLECQG